MTWHICRSALPNDRRFTLAKGVEYAKKCAGVAGWDMDVAAEPEHHVAPAWYGPLGDATHTGWLGVCGLEAVAEWRGNVFCNPPWSQKSTWVEAVATMAGHDPKWTSVTMVLPATVDQHWWQDFVEPNRGPGGCVQVYFPRGRHKYGTPEHPLGEPDKTPQFATCILVWRPGGSGRPT